MSPFNWYKFYITLQWLITYAPTLMAPSPHHLASNDHHRRSQPSRNTAASAAAATFNFGNRSISAISSQRRIAGPSPFLHIIIGNFSCHGQHCFSPKAPQLLPPPSPLSFDRNIWPSTGQKCPVQINLRANAISPAIVTSPQKCVVQSPQCDCMPDLQFNFIQLLPKCSIAAHPTPILHPHSSN